jgi:hypothetical protein
MPGVSNSTVPTLSSFFDSGAGTRRQLNEVSQQADSLAGLRSRVNASIGNAPRSEGRKVRDAASLAVQQQLGDQETGAVTQGDLLSNALRRAKARVGIASRGDNAIRNQQLKDRLVQVRAGISDKSRAINEQLQGTSIRTGVANQVREARQFGKDATASAFGGALGSFGALLKGNKQDNGSFFDFGKKNSISIPRPDDFIGP